MDSDIPLVREPASRRYYSVAYRFKDDGSEDYTRKIHAFKNGDQRGVLTGSAVLEHVVRRIMGRQTALPFNRTYLFTAISHADGVINRLTPLFRAGTAIATACGIEYPHRGLTKQPHDALSSQRSFAARMQQIERAAYACQPGIIQGTNPMIFILDDILTRGDTVHAIANSIMATNPGNFHFVFVSLGKSETKSFWSGRGIELCNTHVPQGIAALWN